MKKLIALLLALALLSSCALAAPMRDEGVQALSDAELIAIRPLLDAFAYSALLKGENVLRLGETPSQDFQEGLFLRLLARGALMRQHADAQTAALTHADLSSMYAQAFTSGAYTPIAAPHCPCITVSGDGLTFDLSDEDTEYVGAYVYASEETANGCVLACDLYMEHGYDAMPAHAPEEALVWVANASFTLARNENAPYGFTLSAFEIGAPYAASSFVPHSGEELGYEIYLPDIFMANMNIGISGFETVSEDGAAALKLEFTDVEQPMDIMDYANSLSREGHTVMVWQDMSFLVWQDAGVYCMQYVLGDLLAGFTLYYPPERAQEFTLYAEFMRNSFSLTAFSVG